MTKTFLIKDYMNANPTTVTPDTSIEDVAKLTLKHKLSGVLVADADKNFLGMISELDCLRVMSDNLYHDGRNAPVHTAKDIMTKEVTTASPNAQLFDVVTSMLNQGQRRRPVVQDDKLVGQVTCRQLLKIINSFA